MALNTVSEYVTKTRELLQDTTAPNRYSSGDLKDALGFALSEARRLRPDLFPAGAVPDINSATSDGTAVVMDVQYRLALVYYMVGHAMLRDDEEGSQQLARTYKQQFGAQLVSLAV